MCGLCTKYKRLPLSQPPLVPSERFQPGAPAIPPSAALGRGPDSLGGRSQRGGGPGLLPPPRVMQLWGGLFQVPPPGSLRAGIRFHPSLRIGRACSRQLICCCLSMQAISRVRGDQPCNTRSYTRFPSPASAVRTGGGARWRGAGVGRGGAGASAMASRSAWRRPRNYTLRAALAGLTQLTHFCCWGLGRDLHNELSAHRKPGVRAHPIKQKTLNPNLPPKGRSNRPTLVRESRCT